MNQEEKSNFETVLIMQGGGSLGAYECGVYKTLAKHEIKFDIVAGTSIGAVNASIIAGSKSDRSAENLEDFWIEMSETFTPLLENDKLRAFFSSMHAAMYGNTNGFRPIWFTPDFFSFSFNNWPYLYEIYPLKETLQKYVDFKNLGSKERPRLLVTSTDIQNGRPVIFDSQHDHISAEHVLASAGYPFYGISWTQIKGRYLWDGTLLSNTPLREVIYASPRCDKKVYIISLFPKIHEELPKNMFEAWHRARDLMHVDKTDHSVMMSKVISRYLVLLKEMHDIIGHVPLDDKMKTRFGKLEPEYHKLAKERGAIIKEVIRIERKEESFFIFEDADFSLTTIRKLIEQGEKDAERVLAQKDSNADVSSNNAKGASSSKKPSFKKI
ncbi:MAG: patatin-like phospholipase family protein [Thaumarchaeota archaeon]|nr:patatin-like phospholipase family protein [Nitrososphaerota archaeon]